MTQKQIDELRSQYTDKFPIGYQYSKARDDVTALLDEIELLKGNLKNNQSSQWSSSGRLIYP